LILDIMKIRNPPLSGIEALASQSRVGKNESPVAGLGLPALDGLNKPIGFQFPPGLASLLIPPMAVNMGLFTFAKPLDRSQQSVVTD